ncbi:MAG: cytochrome-c peroxidase [Hyphomicrobiaceae bacterium]
MPIVGLAVCTASQLTQITTVSAQSPSPPIAVWKQIFARPRLIPAPRNNWLTEEKAALGRLLFYDRRLSGQNNRSCVSCHNPRFGLSDNRAKPLGLDGTPLARNAPALWNLAWGTSFYWDGREKTLESQARVPIEHPNEMAGNLTTAAERFAESQSMLQHFRRAFPDRSKPTPGTILMALTSYVRSLVSPPTRFDRWISGNPSKFTNTEFLGFSLFVGKAGCLACHGGWRFTDDKFHDIGLDTTDPGRGTIGSDGTVVPRFKTPGLRDIAESAPYMHDGSKATLSEVLDHYAGGISQRPSLAANLNPKLRLSEAERRQLIAFLRSL